MTTEDAVAREFDLIVAKYGVWSLETIDAAEVRNGGSESKGDILLWLQSILETGKSWRNEIKPDPSAGAYVFGVAPSEF